MTALPERFALHSERVVYTDETGKTVVVEATVVFSARPAIIEEVVLGKPTRELKERLGYTFTSVGNALVAPGGVSVDLEPSDSKFPGEENGMTQTLATAVTTLAIAQTQAKLPARHHGNMRLLKLREMGVSDRSGEGSLNVFEESYGVFAKVGLQEGLGKCHVQNVVENIKSIFSLKATSSHSERRTTKPVFLFLSKETTNKNLRAPQSIQRLQSANRDRPVGTPSSDSMLSSSRNLVPGQTPLGRRPPPLSVPSCQVRRRQLVGPEQADFSQLRRANQVPGRRRRPMGQLRARNFGGAIDVRRWRLDEQEEEPNIGTFTASRGHTDIATHEAQLKLEIREEMTRIAQKNKVSSTTLHAAFRSEARENGFEAIISEQDLRQFKDQDTMQGAKHQVATLELPKEINIDPCKSAFRLESRCESLDDRQSDNNQAEIMAIETICTQLENVQLVQSNANHPRKDKIQRITQSNQRNEHSSEIQNCCVPSVRFISSSNLEGLDTKLLRKYDANETFTIHQFPSFPSCETVLQEMLHASANDATHQEIVNTIKRCCCKPAEALGVANQRGKLKVGFDADIVVISPDGVQYSFVGGKAVYSAENEHE